MTETSESLDRIEDLPDHWREDWEQQLDLVSLDTVADVEATEKLARKLEAEVRTYRDRHPYHFSYQRWLQADRLKNQRRRVAIG